MHSRASVSAGLSSRRCSFCRWSWSGFSRSSQLGVDLFPKVDIPAVAVIVSNPGASPEEIETEITKKVEDAVNTISRWTNCAPFRRKASRW